MRRSMLLTAAVLGSLVCLIGATVVYSALQDTARTGTNSLESAELAGSANIQLATATRSGLTITCGTFSEDLTSGLFTATGVAPGYSSPIEYFCIKNVGGQQVTLSALADELTDVDFACTGDEAANGDATCGGDQVGELSSIVGVGIGVQACANAGAHGAGGTTLTSWATNPAALGTLAAGATGCYSTRVAYASVPDNVEAQKAQSDRATWRFKFTAQA